MIRRLMTRGFSLVELMVVILIIGVLASMTFVGFTHAQKKAQAANCLNNLRQIGTAIISYASLKGGGYLPNFSADMNNRVGEQWVWELDFIQENEHYFGQQDVSKIVPPRMAPAVLRCPSDVQLFVNSQSMLTSYWMHPGNSYKLLSSITNADETMLGLEGDAVYTTGNCGCRFADQTPPDELDTTHFGGGHILFANGSVQFYNDPEHRKIKTWEDIGDLK